MRYNICGYKMKKRGHEPGNVGSLRSWERQEKYCPYSLQKGKEPYYKLDLIIQNCKIINLCCLKLLSLETNEFSISFSFISCNFLNWNKLAFFKVMNATND